MKIANIQSYNFNAMNCDSNKAKNKTAFTAQIPAQIERKVLTESVENGSKFLSAVKAQLTNIRKWGKPDTVLNEAYDLERGITSIGIDNFSISKSYGMDLPNKSTLVETIMSLKEKDIINAEKELENIVDNNKTDLIMKAFDNPKLMKKITGKVNPDNNELAAAIDKLPEERITELRFGLDEPSKYTLSDDIIHFDFPEA